MAPHAPHPIADFFWHADIHPFESDDSIGVKKVCVSGGRLVIPDDDQRHPRRRLLLPKGTEEGNLRKVRRRAH
jgi:hypothetical protein